jgi:hypothetical protein
VHLGFWCINLRERFYTDGPDVDGRIIINGSSGTGMGGQKLD